MKDIVITLIITGPFALLLLLIFYDIYKRVNKKIRKSKIRLKNEKNIVVPKSNDQFTIISESNDENFDKLYKKYNCKSSGLFEYSHIDKLKEFDIILKKESFNPNFKTSYFDLFSMYLDEKEYDIKGAIYTPLEIVEDFDIYAEMLQKAVEKTNVKLEEISAQSYEEYIEMGSPDDCYYVNFTYNKEKYKWKLELNYDWFDISLFERLNKLFIENNEEKLFYGAIIEPMAVIVYLEKSKIEDFKKLTNFDVKLFQ